MAMATKTTPTATTTTTAAAAAAARAATRAAARATATAAEVRGQLLALVEEAKEHWQTILTLLHVQFQDEKEEEAQLGVVL